MGRWYLSVLGIAVEENEFCCQANIICDLFVSTLKIGLSEISIKKGNALTQLLEKFL